MKDAKPHYTKRSRENAEGIFFDDGEHGLEVEHMDCQEEDGSVTWGFQFTILGNNAYLSEKNVRQLIAWLMKVGR